MFITFNTDLFQYVLDSIYVNSAFLLQENVKLSEFNNFKPRKKISALEITLTVTVSSFLWKLSVLFQVIFPLKGVSPIHH